jgi:hypothetical protein
VRTSTRAVHRTFEEACAAQRNPVVRETQLRQFPDWVVREYKDGTYDAAQCSGPGLSPGCDTFHEAVAWVRTQELLTR